MSDNSLRRKTRSASICAPGFSSMEQMLEAMPPSGARERDKVDREKDSGSGTPDGSTPTRRRRPATRSQSARVSGANKSIRRRAAAQGNHAIKTVRFFSFFSQMRFRDLFVMEILFDGRKVTCLLCRILFEKIERMKKIIGVKGWGINFGIDPI